MLVETTRSLQDPSGKTLYEAWKATPPSERKRARSDEFRRVPTQTSLTPASAAAPITPCSSTSSACPSSVWGSTATYGVYHSTYDDFYWMNHFGDPGYRYHTLMSQLWGVTALRLANADLLPFDFASYADNIRQFVNELSKDKDMSQLDLDQPIRDGIDKFEAAGKSSTTLSARKIATGQSIPKSPPHSTAA